MKLHANAASSLGRALPGRGRERPARSFLRAASRRQPDRRSPRPNDRRAAPVALHRPRDRGGARDGALDRLGHPHADRHGTSRQARARAGRTLRTPTTGRAHPHRRQKLGKIARPGHRVLGRQSAGGHHRRDDHHGWEFVHVAIDDCTRLAYIEVLADGRPSPRSASCAAPLPSMRVTASASNA